MPPPIANDRDVEAARRELRRLSHGLAGFWWERIHLGQAVDALSFFTVEPDDLHDSVRLMGKAYDRNAQVAEWNSDTERLTIGAELEVTYVRKCRRFDVKSLGWRPGLAEVRFHARSTEHHKKGLAASGNPTSPIRQTRPGKWLMYGTPTTPARCRP